MKENVLNKIKEYRVNAEITQEELAKAVSVSRQSINSIERGHYIPSLPLAMKFAAYFNCSIENLFTLEEK